MKENYPIYQPMRSLIYAHVVDEEYRHKMQHFLLTVHMPESIAQFQPYVTKYAFYSALPVPKEGERFGTYNFQLTEHYWTINPLTNHLDVKTFEETFPPEVLVWQGTISEFPQMQEIENIEGDELRSQNQTVGGSIPFVYAFIPVWWEEDLKGKGRKISDGPNYRWQFLFKYPDGVSNEDGDAWFYEALIPYLQNAQEVTRVLSSKIIQEINGCAYYRAVEVWFDGPREWYTVMVKNASEIPVPSWNDKATQKVFPYMAPLSEFVGIFLTDIPSMDNLNPYFGYTPMR